MNVKSVAQFLAITCLIWSHALALSVPSGGCYECEEEVWEEVPCDEVPKNTTTSTTTSTTSTSTTTTTPNPITMEDAYKKCYCECKVGCKEFCRKVVVNPEPKKKILQVSKITEPISQGRLESTHYHQRELIPQKTYGSSYNPIYSSSKSYSESDKYAGLRVETPPTYYVNPPSASAYAKANTGHDQSYGAKKSHTQYYSAPATTSYDFSIPYANTFSKLTKSVGNNIKVAVSTSSGSPYSSSTQVNGAEIDNSIPLGNSAGYDSVESYIKDIMQGSPSSNYQSYDGYGGHHYSMSFR